MADNRLTFGGAGILVTILVAYFLVQTPTVTHTFIFPPTIEMKNTSGFLISYYSIVPSEHYINNSISYYYVKIPDSKYIACFSTANKSFYVNTTGFVINSITAYPVISRQMINVTKEITIVNDSGTFVENQTTEEVQLETGKSQEINVSQQTEWVLRLDSSRPIQDSIWGWKLNLSSCGYDVIIDQDPEVTVCGSLNSANTSYNLTSNLNGNGSCFALNATNITLDCNGYTITGNTTGTGVLIGSTSSYATIKNCKVSNFSTGLDVGYTATTAPTTLINNTLSRNRGVAMTYGAVPAGRPVINIDGMLVDVQPPSGTGFPVVYGVAGDWSNIRFIGNTTVCSYNSQCGSVLTFNGTYSAIPIKFRNASLLCLQSYCAYSFSMTAFLNDFDINLSGGNLLVRSSTMSFNNSKIYGTSQVETYNPSDGIVFNNSNISSSVYGTWQGVLAENTIFSGVGQTYYISSNSMANKNISAYNTNIILGGTRTDGRSGYFVGITGFNSYNSTVNLGGNSLIDCNNGSIYSPNNSTNVVSMSYFNTTFKNCKIFDGKTSISADCTNAYCVNSLANSTITNITFGYANVSNINISSGGNRLIYNNNFSSVLSSKYIIDTANVSNIYNTTEGNIYANILNGSVNISGRYNSTIFPGLYLGSLGSNYPYNTNNSGGKFVCNIAGCADYVPLTNQLYIPVGNLTVNASLGGSAIGNNSTFNPPSVLPVNATINAGFYFINWTTNCNGNFSNATNPNTLLQVNNETSCYAQANFAYGMAMNTSTILPVYVYTTYGLLGYCNATVADNTTISYNYTWFLNGAPNASGATGAFASGVNVNVANISNNSLAVGQNWTLQCLALGSYNSTSVLNSSIATVLVLPNITASFSFGISAMQFRPTHAYEQNVNPINQTNTTPLYVIFNPESYAPPVIMRTPIVIPGFQVFCSGSSDMNNSIYLTSSPQNVFFATPNYNGSRTCLQPYAPNATSCGARAGGSYNNSGNWTDGNSSTYTVMNSSLVYEADYLVSPFTTNASVNVTYGNASNVSLSSNINVYGCVSNSSLKLRYTYQNSSIIGTDGALVFTTGTKSYGNLIAGTDYVNVSDTLYLNLNRPYRFTNFTLGAGTILTTNSTNGTVMYISVSDIATINGIINLSGILNTTTVNYTIDDIFFQSLITGLNGNGGAGGTGGSGVGGNGSIGSFIASTGGSGGAAVCRDVGNYGATNGNPGSNYSAGGGGGIQTGSFSGDGGCSGAGGNAYGLDGGNGSGGCSIGTSAYGGGGGAGGLAGKSGVHFFIKTTTLLFNGTINTRGINGTKGGNGGLGSCGGLNGNGGSGGAGGSTGSISLYSTVYSGSGTTYNATGYGGLGGNGGQNGSAGQNGVTGKVIFSSLPTAFVSCYVNTSWISKFDILNQNRLYEAPLNWTFTNQSGKSSLWCKANFNAPSPNKQNFTITIE